MPRKTRLWSPLTSRVFGRAATWLWQRSETHKSGLEGLLFQPYRRWHIRQGLVVEPVLGDGLEDKAAKEFWSSVGVRPFYAAETHWATFMAFEVKAMDPTRVLEFGCNVGRNLVAVRKQLLDADLKGVDINVEAVRYGRKEFGLDLIEANETFLASQPDGAFDVVFTVSVLDHIPEPKPVLEELVRVAKKGVLLLEPDTGVDGKVVQNAHGQTGEITDTTPFSYSWDIAAMAQGLPVTVTSMPYVLENTNLGQHYRFFKLLKK